MSPDLFSSLLLKAGRSQLALSIFLLGVSAATLSANDTVEGFTEPFRTVLVASAETGLLQTLNVKVGDQVTLGQVLGSLDDEMQQAQLAIAQQQATAKGKLQAAEAERLVNQRRYEKLAQLVAKGQASPEETDRAKANLEIAEGRLLAELDERRLLELQMERARLALDKRSCRAPASGVVAEVHRQVGEFVSPAAPQIVTLVELNPLAATFSLTRAQLNSLRHLRQIRVQLVDSDQQAVGTVESISPITDAESGTTAVRIRLANPTNEFRSGERCRLELP
jgi:RND family efflux transporter MFP subunit